VKKVTVQVQDDHLETLAKTKPVNAMSELIWNALDADATEVRVTFEENELGGLERINIIDNGHGLYYDDAFIVFQNLGGSWKRKGLRTGAHQRVMHGKFGKGRFRAFSLGNRVSWNTVYDEGGGHHYQYSVQGQAENLGEFNVTDRRGVDAGPGMHVEITHVPETANLLRGVKAVQEITDVFALYLRQYPGVKIVYDAVPLDPANAEECYTDYTLDEMVMQNGERVQIDLTVVEWNLPGKRGVYFCDEKGFMLHPAMPRLHFRGFSYTAYVKSKHIDTLNREGLLQAEELSDDVRQILDAARAKLREHFTMREAELARDTIEAWQEVGLYPYEVPARTDDEQNERRIFDIYATHLDHIFRDFRESSPKHKRLTLALIRELVRAEPTRVARILDELVTFPEDKEEQILELV
jgi:hypothetical protein